MPEDIVIIQEHFNLKVWERNEFKQANFWFTDVHSHELLLFLDSNREIPHTLQRIPHLYSNVE